MAEKELEVNEGAMTKKEFLLDKAPKAVGKTVLGAAVLPKTAAEILSQAFKDPLESESFRKSVLGELGSLTWLSGSVRIEKETVVKPKQRGGRDWKVSVEVADGQDLYPQRGLKAGSFKARIGFSEMRENDARVLKELFTILGNNPSNQEKLVALGLMTAGLATVSTGRVLRSDLFKLAGLSIAAAGVWKLGGEDALGRIFTYLSLGSKQAAGGLAAYIKEVREHRESGRPLPPNIPIGGTSSSVKIEATPTLTPTLTLTPEPTKTPTATSTSAPTLTPFPTPTEVPTVKITPEATIDLKKLMPTPQGIISEVDGERQIKLVSSIFDADQWTKEETALLNTRMEWIRQIDSVLYEKLFESYSYFKKGGRGTIWLQVPTFGTAMSTAKAIDGSFVLSMSRPKDDLLQWGTETQSKLRLVEGFWHELGRVMQQSNMKAFQRFRGIKESKAPLADQFAVVLGLRGMDEVAKKMGLDPSKDSDVKYIRDSELKFIGLPLDTDLSPYYKDLDKDLGVEPVGIGQ